MKKLIYGRKLKRDRNERKALFKSLMSAVVISESIKTTEQKAKSIKGGLEKLVTKVKKHGLNSNRFLHEFLTPLAIKKMISDIVPRFTKRPGGYTRIIRLGKRFNDDASMVILEWVEKTGQKTEDEKQKMEERSQKSEDGGRKTENGRKKPEAKKKKESKKAK